MKVKTIIKYALFGSDSSNEQVYFVNLKGLTSMPQIINLSDIQNQIEDETLLIVPDPYIISIKEETIPLKYRKMRDNNWNIISEIWFNDDKEILNRSKRKNVLKKVAEKYKVSEKKAKRILTRFWQRGMTKNTLLPDYSNSGGKGKTKSAGNTKRGRPRKYTPLYI